MPNITATPATVIADQRSNLVPRQFACAFAIATMAVLTAGWFSGVRETANVAMGSVLSVAFLPFIIITIGIVLFFVGVLVALLGALFGAGAEGVADGAELAVMGALEIPGYYRWLFSIRHPIFWGALSGLFLGALLLFGLITLIITPGERQTALILRTAQSRIDQAHADTGDYPAPTASGGLMLDGVSVTDGFGRPVKYSVTGKWKVKSYNLSSSGYDGVASDDDMSVSGAMGLAKAVNLVKGTIDGVKGAYNAIIQMKKDKPQP